MKKVIGVVALACLLANCGCHCDKQDEETHCPEPASPPAKAAAKMNVNTQQTSHGESKPLISDEAKQMWKEIEELKARPLTIESEFRIKYPCINNELWQGN